MILLTDEQQIENQTITWIPTEVRSAMNGGRLELLLSQMDADDEAEEAFDGYGHMFTEVESRISELHNEIDARESCAPHGCSDSDFNDGCISALQAELEPLIAARIAQRIWDRERKSAKYQKAFDDNYVAWDEIRYPSPKTESVILDYDIMEAL
jgi:hypothetical protein